MYFREIFLEGSFRDILLRNVLFKVQDQQIYNMKCEKPPILEIEIF